ncbi:hypothetical protein [uncultured Psychroserpens sp.]|uniref:hypothetical protein n=1 Tax=uncultured Psychroserpens sp. TaxID=255436 RepID=UPI00260D0F40|nr:hypothetical protein [uncultured Psychroserpens sp.]
MRTVFIIIFFSLITSLNFSIQAQNDFAKLEKNVNTRAKGLIQELNSSKDTLILKSDALINKVYAVSSDYEREVDMIINKKYIEIPLNNLSKGKHVFVAVQSPIRIVFVVKIFRDNEWLLTMEKERLASKNEKK